MLSGEWKVNCENMRILKDNLSLNQGKAEAKFDGAKSC